MGNPYDALAAEPPESLILLTSIKVLPNKRLDLALVDLAEELRLELGSRAAAGEAAIVHGTLRRVAFLAEGVIPVLHHMSVSTSHRVGIAHTWP